MKEFFGVFRLAFMIIALPLMATAAVSAHQYFTDSQPVIGGGEVSIAAPSMMAGTFRNHAVSIDSDGVVRGRIGNAALSGLAGMKVFFIRDGKIAHQGYTNEDGSFQAVGLVPGAYSFVTTGAKGFAAFGVRLTNVANTATNNIIEVATISPDFDTVVSILGKNLPEAVVNEVKSNETSAMPAAGSNRVVINNGKIQGNLYSLLNLNGAEFENSSVHLIRDKKIVGKSSVDSNGLFSFENVQPGIYEFVAKGDEGIAALSFEAVQTPAPDAEKSIAETTTTETIEPSPILAQAGYASPTLDVAPTVPVDGMIVGEQFGSACDACVSAPVSAPYVQPGFVGTEIGCGAAAGGCCGSAGNWGGCGGCMGGGGFGGFGGGGGLAALGRFAVLGWILTELFDNIDFEDNNNSGPVSPSSPT